MGLCISSDPEARARRKRQEEIERESKEDFERGIREKQAIFCGANSPGVSTLLLQVIRHQFRESTGALHPPERVDGIWRSHFERDIAQETRAVQRHVSGMFESVNKSAIDLKCMQAEELAEELAQVRSALEAEPVVRTVNSNSEYFLNADNIRRVLGG